MNDPKQRFEELAAAINFFREHPELSHEIKRDWWQAVAVQVMHFTRLVAQKREERDIQQEIAEYGEAFTPEQVIRRAGFKSQWSMPAEPYGAMGIHDYKHVCCKCGDRLGDNQIYYRLKQQKIYLCSRCYFDMDDQQFRLVMPYKVQNFMAFVIEDEY